MRVNTLVATWVGGQSCGRIYVNADDDEDFACEVHASSYSLSFAMAFLIMHISLRACVSVYVCVRDIDTPG